MLNLGFHPAACQVKIFCLYLLDSSQMQHKPIKLTSSKYNKLLLNSSLMMKYNNIQSQGQACSNFTCNATESFSKECNYVQRYTNKTEYLAHITRYKNGKFEL
jgi:hypothetical protein